MARFSRLLSGSLVVVLVAVLLSAFSAVVVRPLSAAAAVASDFNPGAIISDELFYSSNAMSVSAVQSFLNARRPTCATGATCLKDYRQRTMYKAPDRYCAGFGEEDFSAAQIIEGVSRSCGISARVLLVLLEKEQALVSSSSPSERQFGYATGFDCPDTPSGCDPRFYGFFNQVYHAARQFKIYQATPRSWNFQAGRVNSVLFNPNRGCGATDVYIQNQATAALYIYTPYQPNAAALRNLYGSGDTCSAYGNRNFWRMWTDWFGPTNTFAIGGGIGDYYVGNGGGSGTGLGNPTGPQYLAVPNAAIWVQRFQNGSIYWSPGYGAFASAGGIGLEYEKRGGPAGTGLGAPVSAQQPLNDAQGGWVQHYQNGRIYWTGARGAVLISGGIVATWAGLGSTASSLGYPIADAATNGSESWQEFERGLMAWTAAGPQTVAGALLDAYRESGGPPSSDLGLPIGPVQAAGDGEQQQFQRGRLVRSTATGAWPVSGGIGDWFATAGSGARSLGLPTGVQRRLGGGWMQPFQSGRLYWGPTGAVAVPGAAGSVYEDLGGPTASGLGFPVAWPETVGGVTVQRFETGVMRGTSVEYDTPQRTAQQAAGGLLGPIGSATVARQTLTGRPDAWIERYTNGILVGVGGAAPRRVSGGIAIAYDAAGGPNGSGLGAPIEDGFPTATGDGGWMQRFETGAILWSPATQGVVVRDSLAAALDASGGPTGAQLGYPSATEQTTAGLRSQAFTGGTAVLTDRAGAGRLARVYGGIDLEWRRSGGLSGSLGVPTTQQTVVSGVWSQYFTGGALFWTATTGVVPVSGPVGAAYTALGGARAPSLGYPLAASMAGPGDVVSQQFANGRIIWSPSGGARAVGGGIGLDYSARGGLSSSLGAPTENSYPRGDGGWSQRFSGGVVYWSPPSGARPVPGGIGEVFEQSGGPAGSGLGYPVTDQQARAGGTWIQYFQRGSISWSAAGPSVIRT